MLTTARGPTRGTNNLSASVVVCTASHERAAMLRACVRSLLAGARRPDELLVVVDSNPSLEAELASSLPRSVRVLRTDELGLSGARNVGVRVASADVIAFVDDDATVEPEWLSSLMGTFELHDDVVGAGGPVVPNWGAQRRWMPDELLWVVGCTYRGHREDSGPIRNPIGCNMAFRRRDLLAAGSFATRFGKRGNALETCDETELSLRLERVHGPGRIRYVPTARVQHFVPRARISWRLLVRRSLSEGLAKGRLQRLYAGSALGPERSYARDLLTRSVPRLLLRGIRARDRWPALGAGAILLSLVVAGGAFIAGAAGEGRRLARLAHGSHANRGREMQPPDLVPSATAQAASPPRRIGRQLLDHVRVPLHRDGYALALNSAFTAATGLLYWILAAKTYSAHAVGLNSALISSMMFLAGIASLNLPNVLVRFLPESGRRTRRRVLWSYAVAASVALGAAVVFIAGVGAWAPRLSFLHSDGGLRAWFLLSTVAWCFFAIQDSVLTALGRAVWVPIENAVFSLLKLGLLAVLVTALPLYGIFASWTIAMVISVVGVNVVMFARLMGSASRRVEGAVLSLRDRAFARYFAADYMCSIALLSTANLIPVIVTAVAGATVNAYYALAYAVALPLYVFAQNIGTSLVLHGTFDRSSLSGLTRKAAVQGARVLVPAVALLVLLAPYLLSLFGTDYAEKSTTVLRLLGLGALPNFVLTLALSVSRVQRRLRRAVIALGMEAVLSLALVAPLLHAFGVSGAALAWVSSQCVVAAALLMRWRRSVAVTPAPSPEGAR